MPRNYTLSETKAKTHQNPKPELMKKERGRKEGKKGREEEEEGGRRRKKEGKGEERGGGRGQGSVQPKPTLPLCHHFHYRFVGRREERRGRDQLQNADEINCKSSSEIYLLKDTAPTEHKISR